MVGVPKPLHRQLYPEEPGGDGGSVADRETFSQVRRTFDLVGQRDGIVGKADRALAVGHFEADNDGIAGDDEQGKDSAMRRSLPSCLAA